MKQIFALLFLIASPILLASQSSGVITFTESRKLRFEMEGASEEMMKKIPKSHNTNKALVFNNKESVYKNIEKNNDTEISSHSEGNEMKFVMKVPESTLYNDVANNKMIHSQDLFGKLFLVMGPIKKNSWKITGESKTLLDYTCQKAILQDTTRKVEAWFTTKLPANLGPQNFGGLPGTVLMIDIDGGEQTITASKIDIRALNTDELIVPSKGKEVTSEEFEKIRKEKMAEMGMSNSGKGGAKIIIRNETHN